MGRSWSIILKELLCSSKPGVACNIENRTVTVMTTSWYTWWSMRQFNNKDPILAIERTVLNIKGIMANFCKLKATGNTIRKAGCKKPAMGVYKVIVEDDHA